MATKKARKKGIPGTAVRVRGHTRSPRGANTGKRAVYVGGYRRREPRRKK